MKIRDILFKICRNIMHHKFIKSFSELGFYLIAGMIYSLGSYTATLNESTKVRHVFFIVHLLLCGLKRTERVFIHCA